MKTVSLKELKKITKRYIDGKMDKAEIFQWAAKVHWQYAGSELKFKGGDKREMLEFIFELMHLNDERFADSKETLQKKLEAL